MQRSSEWFARNPVAANLLMVFIIIGGLIGMYRVRGETFPDVALDRLNIEVPYPGAAPEEVETAVCIRIEEAIQGIEDIEEIVSAAHENICIVRVQVALHADSRSVLDDVKTRVDAKEAFPARAEKPIISDVRRASSPRSNASSSTGVRLNLRPKRAWRSSSSSRLGTTENAVTQPWATSAPRSLNGPRRSAPHVQRRPPINTTEPPDSALCGSTTWRFTTAFKSCLTRRLWVRLYHQRRSLTSRLVTKAPMCPRDRGNSTSYCHNDPRHAFLRISTA